MSILTDKQISSLIDENVLINASKSKILSIGYDLTPHSYFNTLGAHYQAIKLAPTDSIFVRSVEAVNLPNNIAAMIKLRNSRIRQVLQLEAPIYQPGHSTSIYYRITNISKSVINLSLDDGSAYIVFYELDRDTGLPYNGAFQHESEVFFAMSTYAEKFMKEMSNVEDYAFLIMPFGEKWSENMHQLVKKVGEDLGLRIIRADDIYGIRPVMHDIAKHIEHARVIIAIMTGGNRNVNYELGLAHAWGKPSVMIAASMNDIPFDYHHLRTITYDSTNDPDWGKHLEEALQNTLVSVINDKIIGYDYFEANHQ